MISYAIISFNIISKSMTEQKQHSLEAIHEAIKKHHKTIIHYKKKFKFHKLPTIAKTGLYLALYLFLIAGTVFYFYILKDLPSTAKIGKNNFPQSSRIFDRKGRLLFTIYQTKNQTFVPISKIPKSLIDATIAIEDKDYYTHGGIDPRGIIRALYVTLFKGKLQGGSTITQQLVKNSLLTPDRTINRKIKEVILSFIVETIYSKNKILEMYFNYVPYGGTAWGIQAASQVYFEKDPDKLTLSEAAFLAGLPEAPSLYSPFGPHPEYGTARQHEVLRKMKEQQKISKGDEEDALGTKLKFSKIQDKIRAPHFVFYVKELLVGKYGERVVEQGGLNVTTTLDLDLQEYAQASVSAEVEKLKDSNVTNGAALITNPKTGEIMAMIGSKDYFDKDSDGNVNITLAKRQPGSSIKPINYAAGLGKGYTAATPFVDQKICFPNPSQDPYCPQNYDGKFHGVVQMRFALGSSLNIPAVKMLKLNGLETMIATASAMGITSFTDPDRYGLSLTLGGGEVTMIDMAEAFGVFANLGYKVPLQPLLKVEDNKGNILFEYKVPNSAIFGKKVIPEGVAFIISHLLLDDNARSLAFGTNSLLKIKNYPVSVKTGTTNDFRDNWTIGYTPNYLVAAWVGNNNNTPMKGVVSGVSGAAPIWHNLMLKLVEKSIPQWPIKPDSVIGKEVCSISGLLPPPEGTADRCPTRFEYFIKGTEPNQIDPGKIKVIIDKSTNDLAKTGQTDNVEERSEIVVSDPLGDRYCLTCPHPDQDKKP